MRASSSNAHQLNRLLVNTWELTFQSILSRETINTVTSVCFDENLLESQIDDPANVFLIALDKESEILGMANAKEDEHKVIILNRLYVNPFYHGYGIGRALLDEMINHFKSADKMLLEVVADNYPAINFYLNYGFQIAGENKNIIDGITLNVKVMEKKMTGLVKNTVK